MKLSNKILEAVNKGLHFALDDFEDQDELQGQINSKVKYQGGTKEWLDLMNDIVDLGLPSGTLWCKYNLGVNPNQLTKVKDWYGDYYAWGELDPNKTNKEGNIYFSWDTYKYGKSYNKLTKYCGNSEFGLNNFTDNLTELLPEDDAAYQNKKFYNFKFHIPTKKQYEELINYTNNYWIKNYDLNKIKHSLKDDKGIQGLNGRVFEGKNGNQLFIPATGYCLGSAIYNVSSYCMLWSSNLYLDYPYNAYYLNTDSNSVILYDYNRCSGYTIRPVINL